MLIHIFKDIKNEPYEIRYVRVASDGSPPHLVTFETIDTQADGNVDCILKHTPDVRRYSRTTSGWQYREMCLTYVARGLVR